MGARLDSAVFSLRLGRSLSVVDMEMNHSYLPSKKDVLFELLGMLSDVIVFRDSLSFRELPDAGSLSGVAHIQSFQLNTS